MPPLPICRCLADAGCGQADVRHEPRSRVPRADRRCGCGRLGVCELCWEVSMPPLPIPYCRVASHRRSTNHVTCSSVPFDTSGLCNSRLKTSVPLGRGAPRVGNNERRRATGRDLRSFSYAARLSLDGRRASLRRRAQGIHARKQPLRSCIATRRLAHTGTKVKGVPTMTRPLSVPTSGLSVCDVCTISTNTQGSTPTESAAWRAKRGPAS